VVDLQADENAIVAAIKSAVSNFHVEPFPDEPGEYNVKDSRGVVLVTYAGGESLDPVEWGSEHQVRNYRWSIVVISKHRRDHQGVYEALKTIDDTLVGFQLRHHHMRYISSDFVRYDTEQGAWIYRSIYQITN
jgi:hypothetical protein